MAQVPEWPPREPASIALHCDPTSCQVGGGVEQSGVGDPGVRLLPGPLVAAHKGVISNL